MTEVEKKWGVSALGGFQQLPDLLLRSQKKLGLSCTDMVVLLNITMHWWYTDQLPFPGSPAIAGRIGVTNRTVQRSLNKMTRLGLINRSRGGGKDQLRTTWNPNGLVVRLIELARIDPKINARLSSMALSQSEGAPQ